MTAGVIADRGTATSSYRRCRSNPNSEQLPRPGHTLEFVLATLEELDPRSNDQILDGAGDQDISQDPPRPLPGRRCGRPVRQGHRLGPRIRRCAAPPAVDLKLLGGFGDGLGTANGPSRTVEGCHEPVAGGVDLLPRTAELLTDGPVVGVEDRAPPLVAQTMLPVRSSRRCR